MRKARKGLVGALGAVLVCLVCSSVNAIELVDFTSFDKLLNGVAWSEETEPYLSTNAFQYVGDAWEGKMAKIEPALGLGILNYQDITFDSLDEFIDYLKANSLVDVTINLVEASKMFPVLDYVASLIPQYVYVGVGAGLRYDEGDWDFEEKVVAGIKIKFD